jgi:hypothetical protein
MEKCIEGRGQPQVKNCPDVLVRETSIRIDGDAAKNRIGDLSNTTTVNQHKDNKLIN